jgi:hypothetical protein
VAELPKEGVLDIPVGGEAKLILKALRKAGVTGQITVTTDRAGRGVFASRGVFVADSNETSITITVAKGTPVGSRQSLILVGNTRTAKEAVRCYLPAIAIQVAEAKK